MSSRLLPVLTLTAIALLRLQPVEASDPAELLDKLRIQRGIVAVVGLPENDPDLLHELAQSDGILVFFQSDKPAEVRRVREVADQARTLGVSLFVEEGPLESIHLSNNLADGVVVSQSAIGKVSDPEILRVLHPRAIALIGDRSLIKPVPAGSDDWSHPYHGPDNNPQSQDAFVRGAFQTQFIGTPKFSPMPEQSVVGGGRIYKAMGHISHKANQTPMLNTLLCINAYNGVILWKRPLSEGFMIHRNTMVATEDALYMGDHESCKVIDGVTGKTIREITVGEDISDGPVWKWMAFKDDILFALVGNLEVKVETLRSTRRGLGHWPWGMWKGHDYKDPRTAFGYGRTLVAINRKTGERIWHYRDEEFLDARAVCMKNDRIYTFCPERFLLCLDSKTGKEIWRNTDKELLEAIGPNERAQHYVTGYATTCYIKCSDDCIFFAGPQRKRMVAASTVDGKLLWTNDVGNLQLVLRDDAVYAAGPQRTNGMKLDYLSGNVLATFPARRACTRATGCADSIFFRASGGTVRVLTGSNTAQHIAPMRPPCQDGVLVSNGHLYWGPWMCGCQLSLYGNIGLKPVGNGVNYAIGMTKKHYSDALQVFSDVQQVQPLEVTANDWAAWRSDNSRSDAARVKLPAEVKLEWTAKISPMQLPTAPVTADDLVFVADRSGKVTAVGPEGKTRWQAYTAGAIYYPPAVADGRVYVGSADGRVYAFEAQTGRRLWSFRVAAQDRWICVFDRMVSRWPVSGGVAVEDGLVYAAAGITHYDGTFVVALDAVTGELKAHNFDSGTLSKTVNSGISLQGSLAIVDGELRFLGGGVYETARFDLKTLKCLNDPLEQVTSQYRTAFYPYYPSYGKYVSLEHTCSDGNLLCHDASYEGSLFGNLALQAPPDEEAKKFVKDAARDFLRRRGRGVPKPTYVWKDQKDLRFTGFIVASDQLVAAGHPDAAPHESFLLSLNIKDGNENWRLPLPADAVKGGTAQDRKGRIFVSLENGELVCFSAK